MWLNVKFPFVPIFATPIDSIRYTLPISRLPVVTSGVDGKISEIPTCRHWSCVTLPTWVTSYGSPTTNWPKGVEFPIDTGCPFVPSWSPLFFILTEPSKIIPPSVPSFWNVSGSYVRIVLFFLAVKPDRLLFTEPILSNGWAISGLPTSSKSVELLATYKFLQFAKVTSSFLVKVILETLTKAVQPWPSIKLEEKSVLPIISNAEPPVPPSPAPEAIAVKVVPTSTVDKLDPPTATQFLGSIASPIFVTLYLLPTSNWP